MAIILLHPSTAHHRAHSFMVDFKGAILHLSCFKMVHEVENAVFLIRGSIQLIKL